MAYDLCNDFGFLDVGTYLATICFETTEKSVTDYEYFIPT